MALYKPKNLKPSLTNGPINMDLSKGGTFSFEIDGNEPIENYGVEFLNLKDGQENTIRHFILDEKEYKNMIIHFENVSSSYTSIDYGRKIVDNFSKEHPMLNVLDNQTETIVLKNLPFNIEKIELTDIYYQNQYRITYERNNLGYYSDYNYDICIPETHPSEWYMRTHGYMYDKIPKVLNNKSEYVTKKRRTCKINIPLNFSKPSMTSYEVQINSKNFYNKLDAIGKGHFSKDNPFTTVPYTDTWNVLDWIFLKFNCTLSAVGEDKEGQIISYILGWIPELNKIINEDKYNKQYFFEKHMPIPVALDSIEGSVHLEKGSYYFWDNSDNKDYFTTEPIEKNLDLEFSSFFNGKTKLYNENSEEFLTIPSTEEKINSLDYILYGEDSIKISENTFKPAYPIDGRGNNRVFLLNVPPIQGLTEEKITWRVLINPKVVEEKETFSELSGIESFYNEKDLILDINIPEKMNLKNNTISLLLDGINKYREVSFFNYQIIDLSNNNIIYNSGDIYSADMTITLPFLREGKYQIKAKVKNTLGMITSSEKTFEIEAVLDSSSFKKPRLTQLKDSGIHIDWSNIPFLYANFSKGSPQDEDFYYNYPSPIYEKDGNGEIQTDSEGKPIIKTSLKSYVIPRSQNINFNLLGQSCNYLAYCFQPIGQEFGVDTTRKVMTLYGGDYKYEFSTCLIDNSDLTLNIKCYNINTGEQISPSNNEGDEGFIRITLSDDNMPSLQYSDQLYYIWLLDKTNRKMHFKIYYNTNDSNILNGQAVSEIDFSWNFIKAEFAEDSSTVLSVPETREWYSIFEPIQITLEENQVVSYLIGTNQEGIKIDDLNLTSARDYDKNIDTFSFNPNRSNVGYIAESKSQEDISHATVVRVDTKDESYKVVYDGDSYINNFIDYSAPNNIECYYEVYLGETAEAPYRTNVINTGDLGKWFLIVADDYFGPEGYDENKVIVSDIFEFEANVNFGNMSTNTDFSISKNFTKYPKVQRSYANYWSGTLSGLLGVIGEGGRYTQTIDMLNKFKQLAIDPRRKFLKDREGNLWEVAISAAPTIETNIKLDVQLRTKSISWVEVADTTPTMIYLEDYSKATWLEDNIARPVGEYNGRTQF